MFPGYWPLILGIKIKGYTDLQSSKEILFESQVIVPIRKKTAGHMSEVIQGPQLQFETAFGGIQKKRGLKNSSVGQSTY